MCMDVLDKNKEFNENFFSGLRIVLDNAFVKKTKVHHKANAEVIMQAIKDKNVDKEKFIYTIKNLSEDEWSNKYLFDALKKLNEIMGISDDFIKKSGYQDFGKKDLQEIKWELSKKILVDYAKFSREFYDSLKYSKNYKLDKEKELLMYSMMEALKIINESSKQLVEKYYYKKYNANSLRKVLSVKLPIEHLLLRIYFILFNIDEAHNVKKYRKVLSSEITEYAVKQLK